MLLLSNIDLSSDVCNSWSSCPGAGGRGGSVEFTVVPKLNDVSWERSVLLYGMEFLYGNSREGEQQEKGEKMD